MNQKPLNCLATESESRAVNLLQNRQVALQWDFLTVTLRMADLLTLNRVLHDFMADGRRAWAKTYVVALNDRHLYIHNDELYAFCALVQEAVDQLPRRTVRWVDFTVTIAPYGVDDIAAWN